jgi:hypothetical protein
MIVNTADLQSIPGASIFGIRCSASANFVELKECVMVVDLGSGSGLDMLSISQMSWNKR